MKNDPFHLERFLNAQESIYAQVLAELKTGAKRSHWMWFIFPQLQGLGFSETAQFYALRNLDEAKAYLAHPLLGKRLLECCGILAGVNGKTAAEIFGFPDDLKFRSCLTLFHLADPHEDVFSALLQKYFNGAADAKTLELLKRIEK